MGLVITKNMLKMNLVKITENKSSLIITNISNLDFEESQVINNCLLEELEVEPKTQLQVFNSKRQIQETVNISTIDPSIHWVIRDGVMNKIIHII